MEVGVRSRITNYFAFLGIFSFGDSQLKTYLFKINELELVVSNAINNSMNLVRLFPDLGLNYFFFTSSFSHNCNP